MIRNLKAMGLALVAIFAMGALSASSASATDFFTTSTGNPALMTGVGTNHEFNIPGAASFSCTTNTFVGTAKHASSEATVDAAYAGTTNVTPHTTHCNASSGNLKAVDMNSCHYALTGDTTGTDNGTDAKISIGCPVGNTIAVTSSLGPIITVPAQTPTEGGVTYTNISPHAGGNAVAVKATSTGITFTCHPTFTCTLGGIPHHGNNAKYTGDVTVTGYEDTEGLPTPITEGARIGISVS